MRNKILSRLDAGCFKFSSSACFLVRNLRMVVSKECCASKPKVVQDFKTFLLRLCLRKEGRRNIS